MEIAVIRTWYIGLVTGFFGEKRRSSYMQFGNDEQCKSAILYPGQIRK